MGDDTMNERSIKTESASGLASRIMRVALAKSRLKRSGRVRSLSSLLGVGACLGLCSASTFASPGDLDQTFGNLGSVHLPLVIGQYSGIPDQGVLLRSGAALLVIPVLYPSGAPSNVLKIDPSGAIDRTFGDNGFLPTTISCATAQQAPCFDITALSVQQDESIIAGIRDRLRDGAAGVVKYTGDGAIDT